MKYDFSYAKFKDINRNPQNILVFNGKLLDYLQKTGGTNNTGKGFSTNISKTDNKANINSNKDVL